MIRTIAVLTMREALSRRILAALVGLTLLVAAATAWGFAKVAEVGGAQSIVTLSLITSQLLVMVMFMFSFVLGMTAVFIASPAIAGDVESGVALALLARPIRRAELLAGKWLGNVVVLAAHDDLPVTVAPGPPGSLDCPCHGSKYDAATGAVMHGPAPKALASVPVKVDGDSVVSG